MAGLGRKKLLTRYPGIQPFSREYKDVFFGRNRDIETLSKLINVNKLTVLHGKSGLGKSSLLNAGIIPKLEGNDGYRTMIVRFGAYNREHPTTPKEIFLNRIINQTPSGLSFIEKNGQPHSLWEAFKSLQWLWRNEQGVLLVLDQFEEVFSYPSGVDAFGREFSELLFNRMPEKLRRFLYQLVEESSSSAENYTEQIDFIDNAPPVKVLIGIRSDRLSFLDRFSPYIPNILKNCYELTPLSIEQALDAIIKPAEEKEHSERYLSPPFHYDSASLDRIVSYLSNHYHRPVEPFLLQIICQYVEQKVIQKASKASGDITTKGIELANRLDNITQAYYQNIVQRQREGTNQLYYSEVERLLIRFLVEKNLIDAQNHHRISLDGSIVEQKGIGDELLDELVDARLLRREPNTVSGTSYEISHDTLVEPILNAAQYLGSLDEQLEEYYLAQIEQEEAIQQFIETRLIDHRNGQAVSIPLYQIESPEKNLCERLLSAKLIRLVPGKDDKQYNELYPMFIAPLLKQRAEREELSKQKLRNRVKRLFWGILAAVLITLVLLAATTISIYFYRQARASEISAIESEEKAKKNAALAQRGEQSAMLARDSLSSTLDELKEALRFAEEQRRIVSFERERVQAALEQTRKAQKKAELSLKRAMIAEREASEAYSQTLAEKAIADSLRSVAEQKQLQAELQKDLAQEAKVLADKQAKLEQAKELALQAVLLKEKDLPLSLRLAEAAYKLDPVDYSIKKAFLTVYYGGSEWSAAEAMDPDDPLVNQFSQKHQRNWTYQLLEGNRNVKLLGPEETELITFTAPEKIDQVFFTLDTSYLVVQTKNNRFWKWSISIEQLIQKLDARGIPELSSSQKEQFEIKQ